MSEMDANLDNPKSPTFEPQESKHRECVSPLSSQEQINLMSALHPHPPRDQEQLSSPRDQEQGSGSLQSPTIFESPLFESWSELQKSLFTIYMSNVCENSLQSELSTIAQNPQTRTQTSKGKQGGLVEGEDSTPQPQPLPLLNNSELSLFNGLASLQGLRVTNEDTVTVLLGVLEANGLFDYFGVFDGHGGNDISIACRDRLFSILTEVVNETLPTIDVHNINWNQIFETCFSRMDEETKVDEIEEPPAPPGRLQRQKNPRIVGSTALVVLLGKDKLITANCGDSRAVLCRAGVAVDLSQDHKPNRPDERQRIEALGGFVTWLGDGRVGASLAVSRAIGDHKFKPFVIPVPEVNILDRTDQDEFCILASDGLWDVFSSSEACQLVRRRLYRPNKEWRHMTNQDQDRVRKAAKLLAQKAVSDGSKDNVTVVVVVLKDRAFCAPAQAT